MLNFLKGIVIGLGAVSPGLSGSILLVIFGLYAKTVDAISSIFKTFKKSVLYLMPLGFGIVLGVFVFSKIVAQLLSSYQMQTRFVFLGLILGSVPLFYKEVKKKGFSNKYYICIAATFILGLLVFNFNKNLFPEVVNPSIWQSLLLGVAVAASYVVPGIDSAAILSAFGLYNLWVNSLASLNFAVLIPAAVGVIIGVVVVSVVINFLIKKFYTLTFSLIFGLFLSVIPRVLNESCRLALNVDSSVSIILMVVAFVLSLIFSNLESKKSRN